jgi:hypothetical protein
MCYEEWRKTGQVIYQPLIWQLSVVYNCPQHHTPLHLYCPYKDCGRPLPPLAPRLQSGYCTHCDRWLGNPLQLETYQIINSYEQERQIWMGQAIGELLATVPDLPATPCQERFATIISTHVHRAMEGNFSEFARCVRFHRRTVWEWAEGLQVPRLDALLQICSYSHGMRNELTTATSVNRKERSLLRRKQNLLSQGGLSTYDTQSVY